MGNLLMVRSILCLTTLQAKTSSLVRECRSCRVILHEEITSRHPRVSQAGVPLRAGIAVNMRWVCAVRPPQVHKILKHTPELVTAELDDIGNTALHIATQLSNESAVTILLAQCVHPPR